MFLDDEQANLLSDYTLYDDVTRKRYAGYYEPLSKEWRPDPAFLHFLFLGPGLHLTEVLGLIGL